MNHPITQSPNHPITQSPNQIGNVSLISNIKIFIILIFCSKTLNSQSSLPLFSAPVFTINDLTPAQDTALISLLSQTGVINYQFIGINDMQALQANGAIQLNLPGLSCDAFIKTRHLESSSNGDYYWYGHIENSEDSLCSCTHGEINLQKFNGRLNGNFDLNGLQYHIHDLGENRQVLIQKDLSNFNLQCAVVDTEGIINSDPHLNVRNGCNCLVRVLALYTQKAQKVIPDILGTAKLSIQAMRQALRNSNINECELELELVGIEKINYNEHEQNAKDEIDNIINNSECISLRDNKDADIVIVFGENNWGNVLGIAGTETLESSKGFALVKTSELTKTLVAHELGHLFQAGHENLSYSSTRAYCWVQECFLFFGPWKYTIVYSNVTKDIVQYYSNPEVTVHFGGQDEVTGDEDHNNAAIIRQNACIIANWESQPIALLKVNMNGNIEDCPCDQSTYTVTVSGGAPGSTYSYSWQESSDGFNWGPILSGTTYHSTTFPCDYDIAKYIRVKVNSSDGQERTSSKTIYSYNKSKADKNHCTWKKIKQKPNIETNEAISFHNDLQSSTLNIRVNSIEDGNITLRFVNQLGQCILEEENKIKVGKNMINIIKDQIPSGNYYIECRSIESKINETHKIFIN